MKSLCVYCGSSRGNNEAYGDAARALGTCLAATGIDLVYGGAGVGLMREIADAVLEGGGNVIGVMPRALLDRELAHPGLTRLEMVADMHARKARMAALAEGFIALPGGMGTLEELCEMLTWAQLGLHAKPCGVLNVAGYFDGLLSFIDHMAAQGFVRPRHHHMLLRAGDAQSLLAAFEHYKAPAPKGVTGPQAVASSD